MTYDIPEFVNCSPNKDVTTVPDSVLMTANLSSDAKVAFCLILALADRNDTSIVVLAQSMGKKVSMIKKIMQELEEAGYADVLRDGGYQVPK